MPAAPTWRRAPIHRAPARSSWTPGPAPSGRITSGAHCALPTRPVLSAHLACESRRTVYRGVAYDLESYIARHPGGETLLRLALHRDSTALIESYHIRSGAALAHLKRLPVIKGFPVHAVPRWASGKHMVVSQLFGCSRQAPIGARLQCFCSALAGHPTQMTARSMSPSETACEQRYSRAARCVGFEAGILSMHAFS